MAFWVLANLMATNCTILNLCSLWSHNNKSFHLGQVRNAGKALPECCCCFSYHIRCHNTCLFSGFFLPLMSYFTLSPFQCTQQEASKKWRVLQSDNKRKPCTYESNFHLSVADCSSLKQSLISENQFLADWRGYSLLVFLHQQGDRNRGPILRGLATSQKKKTDGTCQAISRRWRLWSRKLGCLSDYWGPLAFKLGESRSLMR